MSQLTDRLERDLREIAAGAHPSPSAWESISSRLGDDAEAEGKIVLAPNPNTSRRPIWIAAAAAVVLIAAGSVAVLDARRGGDDSLSSADISAATNPSLAPPSTESDVVATIPPTTAPFVGIWESTDTDGSSQTMDIVSAGGDEFEVVVRDEAATAACAGAPSTITGTGRLASDERLVIAQPELTCDDGTTPAPGPPPQADLANSTLELDTATDEIVDSFGVVWRRPGSNDDPIAPSPVTVPALASATSGGMWPQSTVEEVRAAQERADAGDPDYTWQVDPQLTLYEEMTIEETGQVELVDRFLREVLGWEAYLFNPHQGGAPDGRTDGALPDQRFHRCAPGRTNPLYPPGSEPEMGELCAPTIDDLRYESVSVDLVQLAREGPDGIWVVNRWRLTAPFAQADPVVVEARLTERLEEFLAARIAGNGAEGHVQVDLDVDVPLLYATTSGAPYERYEIERVDGPLWPYSRMTFSARLFADGDATVVEQEISWPGAELWLDANSTTENGQPVVLSYTSSDGEVTVSASSTWKMWWPEAAHELAPDVWFGGLRRPEESFGSGERIEFVDPVAYDAWCAANGGSPLLSAPADAAAIAQQVIADPNFETTAPVAARIGGVEAVSIDVTLAPGGKACGVGMIDISRWIHGLWEPGWRLRLYLVDLPEGMSVQTLAITVVAPEERFDEVIEESKPIIDSIEFHP